jgi:hypothetical protein
MIAGSGAGSANLLLEWHNAAAVFRGSVPPLGLKAADPPDRLFDILPPSWVLMRHAGDQTLQPAPVLRPARNWPSTGAALGLTSTWWTGR